MATTRLISFRLTDAAIAMLDHLRDKNESINLAAQRLLTERLGLPAKATDTDAAASALAVNNIVDKIVNSEYFRETLEDKLFSVMNSVNGKNAEIEQTVERLGEALSQLSARVNSLLPIGNTHPSEFAQPDNETDDGQDIPTGEIGELLEDTTTLTPDAEADAAVIELTAADDAVPETQTAGDDAIAVEQPAKLMCGVEGLVGRLKISGSTIEKRAIKMTPEAFAEFYHKKDPDRIYWYPQKDQPILQFIGEKKDEPAQGKAPQDAPLLNLIVVPA